MSGKTTLARLASVFPLQFSKCPLTFFTLTLTLLGCVLGSILASAQATTSVRGTVADPGGNAIVGANVVLANAESKTERAVTTGDRGEYQFLLIPPGSYTLRVKAAGFQTYEEKNLVLLVNTPATANVQLKVGATTEVVTVTSEAPAIDMVDASLGNSFDQTQVRDIPLEGRNVPDLLSLQAGVAYTGRSIGDKDQDTRNGAVNGARSDQSNVTLDDVDVNDQSNGYAFTSVLPVTQDSVQEFRVTTTNYGADQGQGSGAQVALVTKSGTNAFHGSLYEDMRNTITSANDYLVKQSELSIGLPNKALQLNRNIFGVSFGGPIQKDRLFFFTNYEGTRVREEQRAERVIPTPSLCRGIFQYADVNGGTTTFNKTDLSNLDPNHIGIDPAMLDLTNHTGYLDRTFCTGQTSTNDTSAGDGLNYAGYVFKAPTKLDNDVFIARLDYHLTADGKHTLFWRGNAADSRNAGAPFLPGKYQTLPGELNPSAPMQTTADHSKGFALGYIAVLSPTMANSFHWGFTRQSFGIIGNTNQQWNQFLGLDQGINFSHNFLLPLHNFVDDFSWTKGTHSFQFGTSIKIARNPRTSYLHSNTLALGTTNWTSPIGFAYTSSTLDPTNVVAHPLINAPEPVTATQYDRPLLSLYGMISDVVANYNLDRQGNVMPGYSCPGGTCGAPVKRNYGLDSYEFYGQDAWRIKPNLTLTYGLRWSFFPAPWETNGFQASTTFGLGTQFAQNVKNMNQGIGYGAMPSIDFSPSGPANHGPGFYPLEKTDWSPRISIAYSPRFDSGPFRKIFGENDKTVIRAGFSRVYDRAGFALINSFDQIGASGFSTTLQNACCTATWTSAEDLPRIKGINAIPATNINGIQFLQPPPPAGFPQKTVVNSQANLWGNDNMLKTPHAYTADFSIGRELPHRFSLQVSYVGRFGRDLLTQRDLTQPLNIKDPISGIDYYTAASALSNLARKFALANNGGVPTNYYQGSVTAAQISSVTKDTLGPTSQYWIDMLPKLNQGAQQYRDSLSCFTPTTTSTTDGLLQSVFDLYYNPALSVIGDEIVGLADIDSYGGLTDNTIPCSPFPATSYFFNGPKGLLGTGSGQFLNNQAFSMYGWSSIGSSSYHALQMNLRKQVSHGFQFDFNYTYSKSIDITSAASRVGFSVYGYTNVGLVGTRLANAFSPNLARAVSDFDATHQFNLNWIAELPIGKGRAMAGNANGLVDAFIGGWQTSGVARWTSGFPFSIDGGQRWPTDWFLTGVGQMTSKPRTGTFKKSGSVNIFADPVTAQQDFTLPLPGGVGSRNVLRGNGYAEWDMSLYKNWKMPYNEAHTVQFRWDVFNVPNLTRFNAQSVGSSALLTSLAQQSTNFGAYTSLLTQPRVMQFALRYEF